MKPEGITVGPDGNLWFTANTAIGRIYPGSGWIALFGLHAAATAIAQAQGDLWFAQPDTNTIGRMHVDGTLVNEYRIPSKSSGAGSLALGPDGSLWFTESAAGKIGRILPSGKIAEYALSNAASGPSSIAAGPDGAMWFTETTAGKLGRITTGANPTVREYAIPTHGSKPAGIATGADGALWFTECAASKIARAVL